MFTNMAFTELIVRKYDYLAGDQGMAEEFVLQLNFLFQSIAIYTGSVVNYCMLAIKYCTNQMAFDCHMKEIVIL